MHRRVPTTLGMVPLQASYCRMLHMDFGAGQMLEREMNGCRDIGVSVHQCAQTHIRKAIYSKIYCFCGCQVMIHVQYVMLSVRRYKFEDFSREESAPNNFSTPVNCNNCHGCFACPTSEKELEKPGKLMDKILSECDFVHVLDTFSLTLIYTLLWFSIKLRKQVVGQAQRLLQIRH